MSRLFMSVTFFMFKREIGGSGCPVACFYVKKSLVTRQFMFNEPKNVKPDVK